LYVCRLGRTPWQIRTLASWRGHVWKIKKSCAFRDSAQNSPQISQAPFYIIYFSPTYFQPNHSNTSPKTETSKCFCIIYFHHTFISNEAINCLQNSSSFYIYCEVK
jgi:hypothetical protein